MNRSINIALLGIGTIGTGVARIFFENSHRFANRSDCVPRITRIVDKDASDRGVAIPEGVISDDLEGALSDPEIDIVVELFGGTGIAREATLKAIANGKHVVTANKALISAHGDEIFAAAHAQGVDVLFEASVGGSIPILRALRESLFTSRIDSLFGIVNGTTNYILTRMAEEGAPYAELLKSAQELGFAEADPSADVKGWDSQQKLGILLRLAFGAAVDAKEILCEGIEDISPVDIAYAAEFGYSIKLLATAKRHGDQIEARVHPAMIPASSVMAGVKHEYNAVEVVGEDFGTQIFYGKGAGQTPTATVVASDVLDIAQRIASGAQCCRVGALLPRADAPSLIPSDDLTMRHYLRLEVEDRAGVLEVISRALAVERISIESVMQKGRAERKTVPLIIMTHEASEAAIRRAIERFGNIEPVTGKVQHIRVEELS